MDALKNENTELHWLLLSPYKNYMALYAFRPFFWGTKGGSQTCSIPSRSFISADGMLRSGPEHGTLLSFEQTAPPSMAVCSLCWSLIILLLLPCPLLAPLYPLSATHWDITIWWDWLALVRETVGVQQGVLLHSRLLCHCRSRWISLLSLNAHVPLLEKRGLAQR